MVKIKKIIILGIIACMLFGCNNKSSTSNASKQNKEDSVIGILKALEEQNYEGVDKYLTSDCEYYMIDVGGAKCGSAMDEESYIRYLMDLETKYEVKEIKEEDGKIHVIAKTTNYLFENVWHKAYTQDDEFMFEFDEENKIVAIYEYANKEKSDIDIENTLGDSGIAYALTDNRCFITKIDLKSDGYTKLVVNDEIISIDGVLISDMKYFEVGVRLTGLVDSYADIVIMRDNNEIELSIKRINYTLLNMYD